MYMYVYLFIYTYIYIYIICNIYIYFHEPSTWRRQDASTANRMFFSLEVGPEFTQCIINEHLGDERRTKWDQPMGPSYDKLEILNAWIEVGLTNLITLSPKIMVNLENGCIWNMITIGNTANISLHWSMIMGRKSKYLTASLFFLLDILSSDRLTFIDLGRVWCTSQNKRRNSTLQVHAWSLPSQLSPPQSLWEKNTTWQVWTCCSLVKSVVIK